MVRTRNPDYLKALKGFAGNNAYMCKQYGALFIIIIRVLPALKSLTAADLSLRLQRKTPTLRH